MFKSFLLFYYVKIYKFVTEKNPRLPDGDPRSPMDMGMETDLHYPPDMGTGMGM